MKKTTKTIILTSVSILAIAALICLIIDRKMGRKSSVESSSKQSSQETDSEQESDQTDIMLHGYDFMDENYE